MVNSQYGNPGSFQSTASITSVEPQLFTALTFQVTAIDFENMVGSRFGDRLTGGNNDNRLTGGEGDDTLQGGILGVDTLDGGAGIDIASFDDSALPVFVDLRLATQLIYAPGILGPGSIHSNTFISIEGLTGSKQNDVLTGDAGDNIIQGGLGNDTLDGLGGRNTLSYQDLFNGIGASIDLGLTTAQDTGGAGIDTIANFQNFIGSFLVDRIVATAADNVIDGRGSSDTVSYAPATAGITISLAISTAQATGGSGSDTLISIENLIGSAFDDRLTGNDANNALTGGDGNDTLDGGLGNDTLDGGMGTNFLYGGDGIDTASFASVTSGITYVSGTPGQQSLGGSTVTLDSIENVIGSRFADNIIGGAADDVMDGGGGTNTLSFATATGGITLSLDETGPQNTGGAGTVTIRNFSNLIGTPYDDVLTGNAGANYILALGANDLVTGGAGNDTLDGAGGNDTLQGGEGDDVLTGAAGNNLLNGGRGDDMLDGGENGSTASYAQANGGVTVDLSTNSATGADGNDSLYGINAVIGSDFADLINDSYGSESLNGGAGDDTLSGGLYGFDTLNGGAGNDTASLAALDAAVSLSLALSTAQTTSTYFSVTLVSIENLVGTAFADSLTGDGNNNILIGGDGFDTIQGGAGDDMMDGGTGIDTAFYAAATGGITLSLALQGTAQNTGGAGIDTITNFENILGSTYGDSLTGDAGGNTFWGGGANDTIDGGDGIDYAVFTGNQVQYKFAIRGDVTIVSGPDGVDALVNVENFIFGAAAAVSVATIRAAPTTRQAIYSTVGGVETYGVPDLYTGPVPQVAYQYIGTLGNDVLFGTAQNDFINGYAGDDAIDGGAGNDIIDGGAGSNFLTGGTGVDTFFVEGRGGGPTWNTITDWMSGEKVTIWGWQKGVSQYTWAANDGTTGYQGATLHGDLNGDGTVDTSVTFSGRTQAELPVPLEFTGVLWFV